MPIAKKAQRTKGNVKPSKSSQAAQLLAASGQAPVGFIGFSSQPAFVPASETFDEAESALDGDFRIVLRKFSKRDTVTKIKALQEFISLCNSKDEDSVKAVVPFWPRIYNKVAIDIDHKVRELSQKALSTLAARVGKTIAPHLKSIMGIWMVSMCDTYPTVVSAANGAFINTFPVVKQAEAVRFCKIEITECLMNNILKQTAQTLSDPLTTSEEDMESKYQRVVSSSLQALRKLLSMLPTDVVNDSISGQLTSLLSSSVFWKHTKSTSPMVKSGTLSVLSAICQFCPAASEQVLNKISPYVFSCLDSTDPNLISYAWEATLSVISSHQECWQHVNWQKAVWPKIKHVLENGCCGQAVIVSPCLLPLLSKIPNRNFAHFFDAFRLGLHEDSVLNSPQEMSALVRSFIECIQYSVKCLAESENKEEIKNLILDQVLVVMQASLTETKPALSKTDLYSSLPALLSAVKNINPIIEEDFWSELYTFIRGCLLEEYMSADKSTEEELHAITSEPTLFQRIAFLIEGLVYQPVNSATSKKVRVRFCLEEARSHPKKHFFKKEKQPLSELSGVFLSNLLVTTFKLASLKAATTPLFFSVFKDLSVLHIPSQAAERLNNKNDSVAIAVVTDLGMEPEVCAAGICEEDSVKSFKSQLALNNISKANQYRDFLCDSVIKLLLDVQKRNKMEGLRGRKLTDDLVVTVFTFVSYIDEQEGVKLLSSLLNNLTVPQITCQFIEHLLGHVKFVPACKQLVEGNELAGKIEQLTLSATAAGKDIGDDIAAAVWKMLTSAVSSLDESDNHLFSQSCLDAVISSCLLTLRQLQSDPYVQNADTVSSVVCLVQALFDKHKVSTHAQLGEIVHSLLHLLLKPLVTGGDALKELESVWWSGFYLILDKKSDLEIQQHIEQSCVIFRKWAQSNVESYESFGHLCKVLKLFLKTLASSSSDVFDEKEDSTTSDKEEEEELAVDKERLLAAVDSLLITDAFQVDCMQEVYEYLYLKGLLQNLTSFSSDTSSLVPLPSYIVGTLYNLNVLTTCLSYLVDHSDDTIVEEEKKKTYHWSDIQLTCLADLAFRLVITEKSSEIKPHVFKKFPEALVPDLYSRLVKCFSSLALEQISAMNEMATHRYGNSYSIFSHGMQSVLELLAKTEVEKCGKVMTSTQSALLASRMTFLQGCLPSSEVVREVTKLITQSETYTSGQSICEAFTLASTVIMSFEEISLRSLGDCIGGFMALGRAYDVLTDSIKLSLFQQMFIVVKQLKDMNIHLLSGSDTAGAVTVDHIHFNISVIRALKSLLVTYNEQYWEFTLCAVVEWIQFVAERKVNESSDAMAKTLLASVCDLIYLAAHTFSNAPVVPEMHPESSLSSVTEKAAAEWNEFFSEGMFSPLLPLFVSLASSSSQSEPLWTSVLVPLAAAISLCPIWVLLAHELPAHLSATDLSSLPDSFKTLLNHLCPLLMLQQRCLEVAAYKLLKSVMEELPKHEISPEEDNKQEEELRSPPEALIQQTELADHNLESLKVVQVDDHIVMDNGTEERAQAMGYLLAWQLLLKLFKCSPNQLRAKYAQYFRSHDSVSHLLDRVFRLIPAVPPHAMLEFSAELEVQAEENEMELGVLALQVYHQCLETLPALVRAWWVDQDRKASNFIDRFTTQYLSSSLIWQQITSVQNTDSDMEGITIRARPAAREVSATYEMAEVTINMSITLPENYPLGKLEVACDKRVGVSQAQWDRWLLQLNIFLQHQNGSIVEGLRLWKGNIDKKFQGVDDCMICFSVIHGTTFQLPRLTCKTCRKKFHSACLYKWFNTSQKSSCPLCRNLF